MDFDFGELRRVWPADLIVSVLDRSVHVADDAAVLMLLLDESCVDSAGLSIAKSDSFPPPALAGVWSRNVFDGGDVSAPHEQSFQKYFRALRDAMCDGTIVPYRPPRYYRARLHPTTAARSLDGMALVNELCNAIRGLDNHGYFDAALGDSCSDAQVDREETARELFKERLGLLSHWSWPPGPNDYVVAHKGVPLVEKGDLLLGHVFDLLEVCHDLAARPRRRVLHDFYDEWDYSDFDRVAGQQVYRWRVNAVLDRSDLDLRLSGSGPDIGLLVHTPGDTRAELAEHVLADAPPEHFDRVAHAIIRFRARDATREDKRDAVKALGDVLERRRDEVKQLLGSKDEGTLFTILNQYDIRHHRADQKSDYDEDFLDWIFWTFLASIAFMDRRLNRPNA